jgi:hypothetical protein
LEEEEGFTPVLWYSLETVFVFYVYEREREREREREQQQQRICFTIFWIVREGIRVGDLLK